MRLDRDVLAHRPRLVVVELGVNDMFGRWPGKRTVPNLRTITQRLRAQGAARDPHAYQSAQRAR